MFHCWAKLLRVKGTLLHCRCAVYSPAKNKDHFYLFMTTIGNKDYVPRHGGETKKNLTICIKTNIMCSERENNYVFGSF